MWRLEFLHSLDKRDTKQLVQMAEERRFQSQSSAHYARLWYLEEQRITFKVVPAEENVHG